MNVLCCGSRGWTNGERIGARIAELPNGTVVIHGGARGADLRSASYALGRGLFTARVDCFSSHWTKYGNQAGFLRNAAMLDLNPDLVIAFSLDTPGTQNTIEEARRRGIEVEVVTA